MQLLEKDSSLKRKKKKKHVIQHLLACAFQSLNKENMLFGWVQLCRPSSFQMYFRPLSQERLHRENEVQLSSLKNTHLLLGPYEPCSLIKLKCPGKEMLTSVYKTGMTNQTRIHEM